MAHRKYVNTPMDPVRPCPSPKERHGSAEIPKNYGYKRDDPGPVKTHRRPTVDWKKGTIDSPMGK